MTTTEREILGRFADYIVYQSLHKNLTPLPREQIIDILYLTAEQYNLTISAENAELRKALSVVATNIGNGSYASPTASLTFLTKGVPDEVRLEVADLKAENRRLKTALENAYKNIESNKGMIEYLEKENRRLYEIIWKTDKESKLLAFYIERAKLNEQYLSVIKGEHDELFEIATEQGWQSTRIKQGEDCRAKLKANEEAIAKLEMPIAHSQV